MMTIMYGVLLTLVIMKMLTSMNPIKASLCVLMSSCIMFLIMGMTTSSTWLPIILLMLFMGGIIMMFMILSSILPNEKSMKTSKVSMVFMAFLILQLMTSNSSVQEGISFNCKAFLMSGTNFLFLMAVILFYFLTTMSTLSSEQTPMRSLTCHQVLIL